MFRALFVATLVRLALSAGSAAADQVTVATASPPVPAWWLPLLTLVSTIVGGSIAIAGSLITEWYKRRVDARGAASALAAELWGIVEHTKEHKFKEAMKTLESQLNRNEDHKFPKLFTVEPAYGPIFEKSIDKLGLFPSDLSDQVVMAYGCLVAFRATFKNLVDGVWDDEENAVMKKANQVHAIIGLLEKGEKFQDELVPRLRRFAGRPIAR